MLYSMTGFGSSSGQITINKNQKVTLVVEIKSLNSRFIEIVCKLPGVLSSLELDIISLLRKRLIRGRVYLNVNIVGGDLSFETIQPNLEIIKKYLLASEKVKSDFKVKGNLTVSEVLNLPNVFITEKMSIPNSAHKYIFSLIEKAADKLVASRISEGKDLAKDLTKFFSIASDKTAKIKSLFEKNMKKKKSEINKILKKSEKGDEEAKLRLDELYSVINKIDISEEVTRLGSHIKTSHKLLKDKGNEKGKRIDFILQEVMRELNTISAKSMSYDISSLGVDVKVELEKIREQVQNII